MCKISKYFITRNSQKHIEGFTKKLMEKSPTWIQNSNLAAEVVQKVTNKQGSYSTLFW